jgi:serine phosphatase RsbU (regulator of sigma subunit)/Tfp pilus assembly protein PilF
MIHSKIILFFFISLTLAFCSTAQNDEINSLLNKKDSKNKVIALINSAENFWQIGDYSNGMIAAEEARKISIRLNLKKEEATALNNIGIIHEYQGRFADALENYFEALKIQKTIKDDEGLAFTYNNIGLVYSYQGDYKKSLDNYTKALKIRRKSKDLQGLSSTYNNIGILYMYQKNPVKALENYRHSIHLDSLLDNVSGMGDSYSNIGLVYMENGEFNVAHTYFKKALSIRENINDKRGIANSCNNIATLYFKQKKNKEAQHYLQRGLQLGLEMGAKDLIEYSYDQLADIAEIEGRFENALFYQKMYVAYRDSIKNEIETKKQTEAEMQFKFDQQRNKELLEKQKEDLVNKQAKQRLTFLIIGLILIVLIVLIFAISLNKRRKNEQSQKRIIEDQKRIVEHKNQEILDSITYAKRIQSAILPTDRIVKEFLTDSFILYKPKDIVAGDFYWIEPIHDIVLFAVADCTGHGVPGALVSVVCHNALNRSVREYKLTEPGEILNKCREIIIEEFRKSEDNVQDGMDISICSLNTTTKELKWSGANSPMWIKKKGQQELSEFKPSKQPIGYFENYEPFGTLTIQLEEGDSIYLFSDGFCDQFGGTLGKKIKSKGLKELLLSFANQAMQVQRKEIDDFFEQWKANQEQIDDVCMIGLRV